jgi:hypothetical protein
MEQSVHSGQRKAYLNTEKGPATGRSKASEGIANAKSWGPHFKRSLTKMLSNQRSVMEGEAPESSLSRIFQARLMPVVLATWQAETWRIMARGQPRQIDPHRQNNQSKMNWRCGSSSRMPTLQD